MSAADWNVTKIILAKNGPMKKTPPNSKHYCCCFTDGSETKKPKLQRAVGSMNEISAGEQYNIFSQITHDLPAHVLCSLLLWTPFFQNLMVKRIFSVFGLMKPLQLVYVCTNHPTGHQDSLLPQVAWSRKSPGMGHEVFLKALRAFSLALSIAQIYYFYRLWQQLKFLPWRIFFNAGGKLQFAIETH